VTRVTLDTNELISAFNFRGKALELIHRAINGEIETEGTIPSPGFPPILTRPT
jgi:hypothetical protein